MPHDHTCLREYATQSSRASLDTLIRRHMDLVYSSALRQVRDPHLAEDVTQAVFLILAKKANTIRDGVAVGGWLLAVTRRTAVHAMKRQDRDKRHERSLAKPEMAPATEAAWEEIAPVLDGALDRLSQQDRDAIVLRVLENQSLAELGAELGISEDTAGKRVTRALARLRDLLNVGGTKTGSVALAATLSARAVEAAPPHVLAAGLSGGVSASALALAKGTMAAMRWTTAKAWGAVAAICLLMITTAVVAAPRLPPATKLNPASSSALLNLPQVTASIQSPVDQSPVDRMKNEPVTRVLGQMTLFENQLITGTTNIFLAGHQHIPLPIDPQGSWVGTSPLEFRLPPGNGRILTLTEIEGLASLTHNVYTVPDGVAPNGSATLGLTMEVSSFNGLSGTRLDKGSGFLAGVFLSDDEPSDPPPPTLNFSNNGSGDISVGFKELVPLVNQTFFIGDGLTGNGAGDVQVFHVPDTATRLFLGFHDAGSYVGKPGQFWDNSGSFVVSFAVGVGAPPVRNPPRIEVP